MIITETTDRPPNRSGLTFEPFGVLKLDRGRELRIDITTGLKVRSVSARLFRLQKGRPDNLVSEPIFLFPGQVTELIATLNAATAAMAALPPIEPALPVD